MFRYIPFIAAVTIACASPANSLAKPKKTPNELITELVDKKKTEIESLKISDELNWYGITLLDPPEIKEAYKSARGTSVHYLGTKGVWDKIEIETADNQILSVAFKKKLSNLYDRNAFETSLKEHISKRLGPSKFSTRYKSTSWLIVREAAFVKWWQDYYWCVIQKATDPSNVLLEALCQQEPKQERISEKISSVFFTQAGLNDVVLRVTTIAYGETLARERERKKSDFGQQLEEGDTSN